MRQTRCRALLLCLALATPWTAQGGSESAVEQAIEYREGLMEVLGWNMKRMGAMLKGRQPWDGALFARRARDLDAAARLDLLAGFPEDSVSDESDAKDEIWLDWETFSGHLETLRRRTAALSAAATGGDREAAARAFAEVGKACKQCHKAFRK